MTGLKNLTSGSNAASSFSFESEWTASINVAADLRSLANRPAAQHKVILPALSGGEMTQAALIEGGGRRPWVILPARYAVR